MAEQIKQEITTEVTKEEGNKQVSSYESMFIEELRNLRESMKAKDKQIESLIDTVKELRETKPIEAEVIKDNYESALSSVYDNLEIRAKQEYTEEEAEAEFQKRIKLLRENRGTPSEALYWGNTVSDMWHAELLMSQGHIKTLKDYYDIKRKAAQEEMNFYSLR